MAEGEAITNHKVSVDSIDINASSGFGRINQLSITPKNNNQSFTLEAESVDLEIDNKTIKNETLVINHVIINKPRLYLFKENGKVSYPNEFLNSIQKEVSSLLQNVKNVEVTGQTNIYVKKATIKDAEIMIKQDPQSEEVEQMTIVRKIQLPLEDIPQGEAAASSATRVLIQATQNLIQSYKELHPSE